MTTHHTPRKRDARRAALASRTKRAARIRWQRRVAARWRAISANAADAGMSTAEYAVGTGVSYRQCYRRDALALRDPTEKTAYRAVLDRTATRRSPGHP